MANATLWRTFHHDGKISPAWWGVGGGGARPPAFNLQIYDQIQSCGVCYIWEGRYTPNLVMYSVLSTEAVDNVNCSSQLSSPLPHQQIRHAIWSFHHSTNHTLRPSPPDSVKLDKTPKHGRFSCLVSVYLNIPPPLRFRQLNIEIKLKELLESCTVCTVCKTRAFKFDILIKLWLFLQLLTMFALSIMIFLHLTYILSTFRI